MTPNPSGPATTLATMRALARSLFAAGVAAVEPAAALSAHLRPVGPTPVTSPAEPLRSPPAEGEGIELGPAAAPVAWLPVDPERRLTVIAIGKAALPMARAAEALLGARITGGVVVAKHGQASAAPATSARTLAVITAGHPVPDADSVRAADAVGAAVAGGAPGDLVLVLLSGGASALLAAPCPGLSLADKQATTALLLASGLPITAVNAVRKQLSWLKGGQLARLAAPATVVTLALSDVPGDDWGTIGSGPTSPDPGTRAQAWELVRAAGLASRLPAAVRRRLEPGAADPAADTPKPGDPCFARSHRVLIGSNAQAVAAVIAAARAGGCHAVRSLRALAGEAAAAGAGFVAEARALRAATPRGRPWCLVAGGETTVILGDHPGLGGRNQEAALAAAGALAATPALVGRDDGMVVLCAGTDGGDGPTDAAGAVVDGGTWARARAAGRDGERHLAGHDAYPLLDATGDLLRSGQTGTNVMDLAIALGFGTGPGGPG